MQPDQAHQISGFWAFDRIIGAQKEKGEGGVPSCRRELLSWKEVVKFGKKLPKHSFVTFIRDILVVKE